MSEEILEGLKKSIIEYDAEGATSWARKAVQRGIDPIKALDVMTNAIRRVGDGFGRSELFLPDLLGAAEAMSNAMPIIEDEIKRKGAKRKSLGTVIVGTVYGDIHDIGKTMVCALLTAGGFTVHDLGVNITAEEFVDAVRKYNVDILAMSALMTMTAPEQKKVIEELKKAGLRDRVKVMIGGAAVSQQFADLIGADGYDPTAPGAVKLAMSLLQIREK